MTEATSARSSVDVIVKRLASAPERATAVALPLRPEAWDTRVVGEWTRRDALAHLAASDLRAVARIRAALGEARPDELAAMDDVDAWNHAQVAARQEASVEALLTEYRANRRALVHLLQSIPPERFAGLTIRRGADVMALADYVSRIDRHDHEHIEQIGALPSSEEGEADAG